MRTNQLTASTPRQYLSRRGARTKATLNLTDLPQGPLPAIPLPEHDQDSTPAYPPVIQQHLNHVRQFSDCVVLTRVGNFYEMYAEQADQFGPPLNLKVAQRRTSMGPVSMAGFQYVYLDRYLRTLVQDLNQHVAISEEVRNSAADQVKSGGLLYTRKVSRIITAGTLVDENFMDPLENNFLLAVDFGTTPPSPNLPLADAAAYFRSQPRTSVGLAWADLSSGDFFTQRTDMASLASLVARIGAKEVVLCASLAQLDQNCIDILLGDSSRNSTFHSFVANDISIEQWLPMLEKPVPSEEAEHFTPEEISAGSLLLDYVKGKLLGLGVSLQCPVRRIEAEYMSIDRHTLKGLEIRSTMREGAFQGSLLHSIRKTVTKSGTRLLNQRLGIGGPPARDSGQLTSSSVSPSLSLSVINNRLDLVELLRVDSFRSDITSLLRRSSDTLRLLQKFSIGKGDADDLLALAKTTIITRDVCATLEQRLQYIRATCETDKSSSEFDREGALSSLLERLEVDGPHRLARLIVNAIDEDGLSRQHLIEEAEAVSIANSTKDTISGDVEESHNKKSRRGQGSSIASGSEDDSRDVWTMRREYASRLAEHDSR